MSIYAIPSTTFQAVLTGAPTGLTGTLGVRVLNLAVTPPSTAIARTTAGIEEEPDGSGIYTATLTAPSTTGNYIVVWDTGGTLTPANSTSEELFVTGTPPTPVTAASGSQASMTLSALRTEVLNHGFDGSIFTPAVLNQYLNDAQSELCSKALYYGEESEATVTLTAGTGTYSFSALGLVDVTKLRTVRITNPQQELSLIDLRDIDRSTTSSGLPYCYAMNGGGITVFPTPDSGYSLKVRYWRILPPLTQDTDVSALPPRYQRSLTYYAIARCFEREDDVQQAQYYDQKWLETIRNLKADLVFPLTDGPRQVKSQWDSGPVKPGWGYW